MKTFVIDIDGTICSNTEGNYESAKPIFEVISMVNKLHNEGHEIVFFTARGSTTGINWSDVTRNQLESWGVSYHKLLFGKPFGNYYIDDKTLSIDNFIGGNFEK